MKRILLLALLSTNLATSGTYSTSVAVLIGGNTLDAVSSWDKYELNPILGRGRFGARQALTKGAMVGMLIGMEQTKVFKRHRKVCAVMNFVMGGVSLSLAVRNFRQK